MELYYCEVCGRVVLCLHPNENCDVCGSSLKPVPNEYMENFRWRDGDGKQALFEELIKTSPKFNQEIYEKRDDILCQQEEERRAILAHGKAIQEGRDKGNSYGVSCPYCGATNVKKILATSRIASVGFFGLGSRKIGKQWHCTKCGSDF